MNEQAAIAQQKAMDEAKFSHDLKELVLLVVKQCADVVSEMPVSASLYENSRVAEAVLEFQMRAVSEVLSLTEEKTGV